MFVHSLWHDFLLPNRPVLGRFVIINCDLVDNLMKTRPRSERRPRPELLNDAVLTLAAERGHARLVAMGRKQEKE